MKLLKLILKFIATLSFTIIIMIYVIARHIGILLTASINWQLKLNYSKYNCQFLWKYWKLWKINKFQLVDNRL